MLFLFKRNKKQAESKCIERDNLVRKQLNKSYLSIKNSWVQWMTNKTASMSSKQLLILWIVFIVFSAGYCIYLITANLARSVPNFSIGIPIVEPIKELQMDVSDNNSDRQKNIKKGEYERILGFRDFMDSLSSSPTGKKDYDSMLLKYPKLLDSIKVIEKYYQSNLKSK